MATQTPLSIPFQSIAAVVLGTILGLLIALPIAPLSAAQGASPVSGILLLLASGGAGALIGHRRRHNKSFLYFCFAAILILSGTITSSIIPQ